jgi:hypothetical protein
VTHLVVALQQQQRKVRIRPHRRAEHTPPRKRHTLVHMCVFVRCGVSRACVCADAAPARAGWAPPAQVQEVTMLADLVKSLAAGRAGFGSGGARACAHTLARTRTRFSLSS